MELSSQECCLHSVLFSGVSRISGGGGSNFLWKSGGMRHAARGKAMR